MRFRDFIPIFTSVACISVPLFQACDGLDTAKGPDDNVYVTFEENNTLLSFCENNYEGTKNLVLNITVAGMTDDPINPMQIQESETFELENEASQILGGTEFPIEVPSTGTFQIAVELRGVLSCFDCCGEILVYENNNQTKLNTMSEFELPEEAISVYKIISEGNKNSVTFTPRELSRLPTNGYVLVQIGRGTQTFMEKAGKTFLVNGLSHSYWFDVVVYDSSE